MLSLVRTLALLVFIFPTLLNVQSAAAAQNKIVSIDIDSSKNARDVVDRCKKAATAAFNRRGYQVTELGTDPRNRVLYIVIDEIYIHGHEGFGTDTYPWERRVPVAAAGWELSDPQHRHIFEHLFLITPVGDNKHIEDICGGVPGVLLPK